MSILVCPNCHSTNLRRSHSRNAGERFLKLFRRRPYRCKDCGWRGELVSSALVSSKVNKKSSYLFAALFFIVIVVLLIVFNARPDVIESIVKNLFGQTK